jgi:antitoxin PrlF
MDARARMTSKGQVTIPRSVREALALEEGDELLFRVERSRALLAKTPDFLESARTGGSVPASRRCRLRRREGEVVLSARDDAFVRNALARHRQAGRGEGLVAVAAVMAHQHPAPLARRVQPDDESWDIGQPLVFRARWRPVHSRVAADERPRGGRVEYPAESAARVP